MKRIKGLSGAVGCVMIVAGLAGLYFFVYLGHKPPILQWPVPTLYSQYIETKLFTIIRNNQGDELSVLVYTLGWSLLMYSRMGGFFTPASIGILIFLIGYFLLHGTAVLGFMVIYLMLSPLILLYTQTYKINNSTINNIKS